MIALPRWIADRLMHARFREEVAAKATALVAVWGDEAYAVAREQARAERAAAPWSDARFWGRVAVEIARREGRIDQIGVKGADRWRALERRMPDRQ